MDCTRLFIERLIDPRSTDTLADDVRAGLFSVPKHLPSKHLYDEEGGRLFEEICTLPEYYPTRTERALLGDIACGLIETLRPTSLIELGSGSSTKTRLLLDAMGKLGQAAQYVPVDVNEGILVQSAKSLLEHYPWLTVRALVADFDRPLLRLPCGAGVLVAFLGGTIGNLEPDHARRFLLHLASAVGPAASLLLGVDRVKDPCRISAAYDDARGVTARFNLNVLQVLNRKLDASFDPGQFRHLAFYDARSEQVEMHLVARLPLEVRLRALGLTARFRAGESVRTEISRKFTPESARELVESSGWRLIDLFTPSSEDFSLVWATARPDLPREAAASLASPSSFP